MIAGFSQYGEGHVALQYLRNMQEEGLKPDQVILCSVLRICGSLDAIGHGYVQLGDLGMAVQYYHDMQNSGVQPRHMVFSGILCTFGRADLVDEGLRYFNAMRYFHVVEPDVFHFTCVLDILGRAACLEEAENLLREAGMLLDICL